MDHLSSVETEFAEKQKQMEQRHLSELSALQGAAKDEGAPAEVTFAVAEEAKPDKEEEPAMSKEEEERQRKLEKARKKREKQKEKERRREEEIAAETAAAGPSPRDVENAQIMATLQPLNLTIRDVTADGNCLYRAVAAQVTDAAYGDIRQLCADALATNEAEFAPFCEYTDSVPDFDTYVQRVRSSADWGGHLELRALSMATNRPIHVYSAANQTAMVIESSGSDVTTTNGGDPILLSYHLHYYALGEHYNQVVPM